MIAFLESTIIGENTLVSIGTAVAILTPIGAAFVWLQGKLNKIDHRLETIERGSSESWSATRMEAWVLRFAQKNPTIIVPDVPHNDRMNRAPEGP